MSYRQRKSIGLSGARSTAKQPTIAQLQKEIKALRKVVTQNQHIEIALQVGNLIVQLYGLEKESKQFTDVKDALNGLLVLMPDEESKQIVERLRSQGFAL